MNNFIILLMEQNEESLYDLFKQYNLFEQNEHFLYNVNDFNFQQVFKEYDPQTILQNEYEYKSNNQYYSFYNNNFPPIVNPLETKSNQSNISKPYIYMLHNNNNKLGETLGLMDSSTNKQKSKRLKDKIKKTKINFICIKCNKIYKRKEY